MSQKELLYIEDAYNHEQLTVNILTEYVNLIDEVSITKMLKEHIKRHQDILDGLLSLLEGAYE